MTDNLLGKKIKVNDKTFRVAKHYTEDNKEIIVLAKAIPKPTTIYDLGYKTMNDIVVDKETTNEILNFFENNIGKDISIGIVVDSSGKINEEKIKVFRRSLVNPDLIQIEVSEEIRTIDLNFVVKSFYLMKLIESAVEASREKPKPKKDYGETIDFEEILNRIVNTDKKEFSRWVDENF